MSTDTITGGTFATAPGAVSISVNDGTFPGTLTGGTIQGTTVKGTTVQTAPGAVKMSTDTITGGTFATAPGAVSISVNGGTFPGTLTGGTFRTTPGLAYMSSNAVTAAIFDDTDVGTGTSLLDGSDRRLKRNLLSLSGALERVKQLNGVYYHWITDVPADINIGARDGRRKLGLIAQDVADVLPEVVSEIGGKNKYLGVDYKSLVAVLIESIKEMDARVEQLEADVASLREAAD
jgi:hypothetical protein